MLRSKLLALLSIVFFVAAPLWGASLVPHIVGLENNALYMQLLDEDARLRQREDSLGGAIDRVRLLLRDSPGQREELGDRILEMEQQIFALRGQRGMLVDRINSIEQEWVLSNLHDSRMRRSEGAEWQLPDSLKRRCLTDNLIFDHQLSAADLQALRQAQSGEATLAEIAGKVAENHRQQLSAKQAYDTVRDEKAAAEIWARFQLTKGALKTVEDSLALAWTRAFDNKMYAYSFLLDKLGCFDRLEEMEQTLEEQRQRVASLEGQCFSDALMRYAVQKQCLVRCELMLAQQFELTEACDSLRQVHDRLAMRNEWLQPSVELRERYFLDYQPIVFSSTSKYNYWNPIPVCPIHPNGTIYRILLGEFRTKQSVSLFRGTSPLCYLPTDEGRYAYYAGGFATEDEALDAQKLLKGRGFRRPEVVVWRDGVYTNLAQAPAAEKLLYRVEITGVETLPQQVTEAVAAIVPGRDITRAGQNLYVVAGIAEHDQAERLADAVMRAAPQVQVEVRQQRAE